MLLAAYNGHDKVVSLLLEAGADKDIKRNDGNAPMHVAAIRGDDKVVSLLLQAGADKDMAGGNGASLNACCIPGAFG